MVLYQITETESQSLSTAKGIVSDTFSKAEALNQQFN